MLRNSSRFVILLAILAKFIIALRKDFKKEKDVSAYVTATIIYYGVSFFLLACAGMFNFWEE